MAFPELPGMSGITDIAAPPRPGRRKPQEAPAPSIPEMPRTTIPKPILPEEQGEPQESWIQKLIKNRGAQFALAGLAFAGTGYVVYQAVPAIHQSVDSLVRGVSDHWKSLTGQKPIGQELNKPILPTYDNKADKQTVQAGINAIPVTKEELPALLKDSIKPVEKGKFPDVTILLPLKLGDGERANISTDWVKYAFNPVHPESKEPVAYGKKITIAQKGTEIIVPVENAVVVFGARTIGSKDYVEAFGVTFYGPDGTKYSLALMHSQDLRKLQPTDLIKNALAEGKDRLPLPIGTSIAVTADDNVELEASLFAYPAGYSKSVPCDFSLVEKEENGKRFLAFIPQKSS